MTTDKHQRVCLIGTGYMGKCHALAWNAVAPTFEDVPRPRLELLVEVNDQLAARRANELGFARSTGNWRSAAADPDVDVVSIASPTWFHAEMAIAALASGKHVWCEKPMSLKLPDSEKMAEAAAKAGTIAVLGYNYIQNPAIRLIKKLIEEGEIGEVKHVRVEMDEDYMADPDTPYNSFFSGPQAGGALEEFGVHPLSLLQVLVGDVAAASADQWKPYATRHDANGVNQPVATYDIAGALLRLANGGSGVFAVNRAAWGRKGRLVIQLYGSRGSIYYDQDFFLEKETSRPIVPEITGLPAALLLKKEASSLTSLSAGSYPQPQYVQVHTFSPSGKGSFVRRQSVGRNSPLSHPTTAEWVLPMECSAPCRKTFRALLARK